MTLARRLRKWGGGGGNRFSPSFILRAWAGGWSGSVRLLTGGGRGWGGGGAVRERIGSSGRGKGAPRSPPTQAHTPPRSFRTLSPEPHRPAPQPRFLGGDPGKVGVGTSWGRERSPEASGSGSRAALFSMPHT